MLDRGVRKSEVAGELEDGEDGSRSDTGGDT